MEQQKQPVQIKSVFREFITILVIAGVIVLGLQAVVQKFVVDGPSMNYTLQDGQQLLVNKIIYNFHPPERGDIVVFHPPADVDTDDYIKRIIGLPGETVVLHDGMVIIHRTDGSVIELEEPYVTRPSSRTYEGKVIPQGEYFVMGDNRMNSSDSRSGWTLREKDIIGKTWLSIWPPRKWGLAPNHDFDKESG